MHISARNRHQLANILVLTLSLTVGGCALQGERPVPKPLAPQAKSAPAPTPLRPLPTNTLYELLVAEFAGIRESVEPALEIYVYQAQETRDPRVIERAIHIANYLNQPEVVLLLAELWSEVEPGNTDVRRLLAFHLARSGRVLEAFPHGEFLLLNGDDDYLQSLAAFAKNSSIEEKQRLLKLYEDLEAQHPKNTGLLLGKAMLLRQLERLEDSLDSTAKLLAVEPGNETGQLLKAQLLHALGDRNKALKSLKKALRILPENKRLRLQYARFLSEIDLEKSRQQMVILSRQYPDDSNIAFSLGLANKELGFIDEARLIFQFLARSNRRAGDAHFQLGDIAEREGKPEEAVYQYRQVRNGQNLLAAAQRSAEILSDHNNLAAAREQLATLRDNYPALRDSLFQIEAELLLRQDRFVEAYDLLTTALTGDPENGNLRYARSIVSAHQKDLAAVEEDLQAILAQDADNPTALNALGYTLTVLSDRYLEALAFIERALELEPDNPAFIDSLGWVHYKLGHRKLALDYLRRAFDSFPDGEVAAHLGEVLWTSGAHEEAEAVWLKGLKQSPEDDTLLETLERLIPEKLQAMRQSAAADASTKN